MKNFGKKILGGIKKVGRFLFVKTEKEHSEKFNKVMNFMNKYSVGFHVLLSFAIVYTVEAMSRRSVISAASFVYVHPLAFLYNSFLVFASLMIVYLFRRRGFFRLVISSFWLLLGIINGCILSNRVTPFGYTDLKCISDLLSMSNTSYFTAEQATAVVFGGVIFILFLIAFFIKGPRYTGKKNKIAIPVTVAAVMAIGIPVVSDVAKDTHVVDTYYTNIAQGYEDNGFIYSFSSSVVGIGMDKPEDYSEEAVDAIEEKVSETKEETTVTEDDMPNIICVLTESWVDPDEVEYLGYSEDPTPFLHSLEDNYTSGYLTVPVVGAGTSNSEFEVLTGMSMQYFGTGEYPHKTILKKTDCESVASDLSSIGYSTHVVHNNGGNFYSRANAFSMMGFDTFTSKELMNITDWNPLGSWPEDEILVSETMKAMQSTEGSDFTYIITVGTHGDYPTYEVYEDPEIYATGCATEELTNQWTYYMNQLHKTDQFAQDLIAEIEESGEDTIVVFFGDHLPTMGLTDEDMVSGDIYKTKYVTWNNMGLEQNDVDLYAYQLMASITDSVGIHEGSMLTYHQTELASGEATTDTETYLAGVEMLQYDILYGERYLYDGEDAYPATDIVMGIDDIEVHSLGVYDYNNLVYVYGSGFTPWCKVFLNGEKVSTGYVSGSALTIFKSQLEEGDVLTVCALGSSNTVFRSSVEYIYQDGQLTEVPVEDTETTEAE